MKPIYKVVASGKDITENLKDRRESIAIEDNAGFDNDKLTITVSDHEPRVAFPPKGTKFEIWMGYEDTPDAKRAGVPVGLRRMGSYVIDGYNWAFGDGGDRLKISGHANDMAGTFKTHKNNSWNNTTVKDVVAAIAAQHGYTPKVSPDLEDVVIDKQYQRSESDQAFLTRIATQNGAIMKVADGTLYFGSRDAATTASGKEPSIVVLDRTLCVSGDFDTQSKSKHTGVSVKYQRNGRGSVAKVLSGTTGNVRELKQVYSSEAEATKAAKAAFNDLDREGEVMNLTCVGHVGINAERKVSLTGFRQGVTTEWLVNKVTHKIDDTGFTSDVVLELRNGLSNLPSKEKKIKKVKGGKVTNSNVAKKVAEARAKKKAN